MLHENTALLQNTGLLAENFRFPLLPSCLRKQIRLFSFERSELENNQTLCTQMVCKRIQMVSPKRFNK